MNSGATWTIADGGVSGKLWAGLHHDRSASPFHRACSLLPPRRSSNGLPDVAYGSIATEIGSPRHVRSPSDSDQTADVAGGPVRAKGGSGAPNNCLQGAIHLLTEGDKWRERVALDATLSGPLT